MADIYLHSRLSEEVIKELPYDFNQKIVFLGAQGPDPLYYNAMSKDHKIYRFYADRMHDTDTQQLFLRMIESVKKNYNQTTYSFLVGFISHYALDVSIHPYVYHNVGVYSKSDPTTKDVRGLHLKFERSIDCVVIKDETGKKAHKLQLKNKYFPLKMVPLDIINIMNDVLQDVYNKQHGGVMYLMAVNKMYKNVKHFITDRSGIKKVLLSFFDLFHQGDLFFKDLSFYNHVEHYDFVNKNKKTWYHPVTNEPSNKDVYEIFNDAKIFALELINATNKYLDNEDIDLTKYFTNLSFNTGIDCNDEREMKYFNIYRKS